MKILISAPTGYNSRELLLPLQNILEKNDGVEQVLIITPAADFKEHLFNTFSSKFVFIKNPTTQKDHDTLIAKHRPNIIVTPTTGLDPNDTLLIRAGKTNNIPTLTFVSSWDNVYKMERCLKTGQDMEIPDYLTVWNRMMQDHLIKIFNKCSQDNVFITGAPRFDYFFHQDKIPSRSVLFDFLNLPDKGHLIHCATTELYPFKYIIKDILKAVKQKKITEPLQLFASVHPGGDIRNHNYKDLNVSVKYSFGRRKTKTIPEFSYFPTNEEIYLSVALYKYSSVLINQSSTVVMEAMLADKPAINVRYGKPYDLIGWRRSMVYRDFKEHYQDVVSGGGTSIVQNRKELIKEINCYLKNPDTKQSERKKTIEKMITYTDGSASQRLFDLIKEKAIE